MIIFFSDVIENPVKTESAVSTIGDGIKFVDAQLILDEKRLRAEKIESQRRKNIEREQQKAEKEAFQREIREQQYKRLMHLLHQSKALTTFITKKIDKKDAEEADDKKPNRKRSAKLEDEPQAKKKKTPKKAPKKTVS